MIGATLGEEAGFKVSIGNWRCHSCGKTANVLYKMHNESHSYCWDCWCKKHKEEKINKEPSDINKVVLV